MLDTNMGMSLLTILEILGPIVLGAALVYGIMRSRRRTRSERAAADAATKRNYQVENAENKREEAA